jgi:hypothetical protein
VVVEQSTQPVASLYLACTFENLWRRDYQPVLQALVVPFKMIMDAHPRCNRSRATRVVLMESGHHSLSLFPGRSNSLSIRGGQACSRSRTSNLKLAAPSKHELVAATNAIAKCPVIETSQPVTMALRIPIKLPHAFCKPVHRPAADGPANVCVKENRFEA